MVLSANEPQPAALGNSGVRVALRWGNFLFKYRDFVFPAVFLALVVASPPITPGGSLAWDRWLDLLGVAVALCGQALRVLVIGLAYIQRGGQNKRIYAEALVSDGFFAHARNPLYVGNFLAIVGFCLIHNSWLCYLVGLPFFAVSYLAIVMAEEDFLGRKFGAEYEAYCRRVPRFVPRFAGLGRTVAGMNFDWRRVVRKEYGSTFSGATFILFLLVWDEVRRVGWLAAEPAVRLALVVWLPFVLLYLLARWAKKSGRLGTG